MSYPLQQHLGLYLALLIKVAAHCLSQCLRFSGAKKAAGMKTAEAITALSLASQMGKLPIVIDNSPCLAQLKSAGLNQQELK